MSKENFQVNRRNRWYFGGLAATGAACCTHPLDLIKVNLQTQQIRTSPFTMASKIIQEHGIIGLYQGISASMLRQLTYSTTRFGIYEFGKMQVNSESFHGKIMLASLAGLIGGAVGTPADMINIRMQNDVRLPPGRRRDYKHVIDGLIRVYKDEGFSRLFSGVHLAATRGVFANIGTIAVYDHTKQSLLQTSFFNDNLYLYFTSSSIASIICLLLIQPFDVLKTHAMVRRPDEAKVFSELFKQVSKLGFFAFYKGFTPALARSGPTTVLTFIFLEKLRLNFGYLEEQ